MESFIIFSRLSMFECNQKCRCLISFITKKPLLMFRNWICSKYESLLIKRTLTKTDFIQSESLIQHPWGNWIAATSVLRNDPWNITKHMCSSSPIWDLSIPPLTNTPCLITFGKLLLLNIIRDLRWASFYQQMDIVSKLWILSSLPKKNSILGFWDYAPLLTLF